jgi:hypothetical protein
LITFFISSTLKEALVISITTGETINLPGGKPVIGIGAFRKEDVAFGATTVEFGSQWIWVVFILFHKKVPLPCGLISVSSTPDYFKIQWK